MTREQLFAAGWTPQSVRAQLAARRWRALNDAVVCTHNGPLTVEQQRWAVLLSAQGVAAMCGLTAMQMWGVTGFETDVVHVVVRRGFQVLPVPGVKVKVHESRRFEASDVLSVRAPAVTSLERATVDAAVWTRGVSEACRVAVAPVQQRKARAQALRRELERAGRVRHRRVLAALLGDLEGGAQALSEVEFLRFCRRHGLPQPDCQVRLDSSGRRRYLDATFRRGDGGVVRVEVDGGIHLSLSVRAADDIKDNDARLDGRLVLRYPSVSIYTDDPHVLRQLRRALGLVRPSGRYSDRSP